MDGALRLKLDKIKILSKKTGVNLIIPSKAAPGV